MKTNFWRNKFSYCSCHLMNSDKDVGYHLSETMAYLACKNFTESTEALSESDIINGIWKGFVNRDVKNINGEPLIYWRNNSSDGKQANKLNYLLSNHNGTCYAWAKLFYYTLKYQGIIKIERYMIQSIYHNLDHISFGSMATKRRFFIKNLLLNMVNLATNDSN